MKFNLFNFSAIEQLKTDLEILLVSEKKLKRAIIISLRSICSLFWRLMWDSHMPVTCQPHVKSVLTPVQYCLLWANPKWGRSKVRLSKVVGYSKVVQEVNSLKLPKYADFPIWFLLLHFSCPHLLRHCECGPNHMTGWNLTCRHFIRTKTLHLKVGVMGASLSPAHATDRQTDQMCRQ